MSVQETLQKHLGKGIAEVSNEEIFGALLQTVQELAKEKEAIDLHYVLSVFKQFLQKKQTYVKINGRMYPVIGEIGLSHTAVDITGTDIKCGDIASADLSPLMVNPRIERIYR